MDIRQQVGTRIRMCRIDKHMTLKELAEKAGISLSLIAMIEYGERVPSKGILIKLAEIFNLYENWLLYGVDRKTNVSAAPIYRKKPISCTRRMQKAEIIRATLRDAASTKPSKPSVRSKKNEGTSRRIKSSIRPRGRPRLSESKEATNLDR